MRANISKKKLLNVCEYDYDYEVKYASLLSYNKKIKDTIQAISSMNGEPIRHTAFVNGYMIGYDEAMRVVSERLENYFNMLVKSEVKIERKRIKEIMGWLND